MNFLEYSRISIILLFFQSTLTANYSQNPRFQPYHRLSFGSCFKYPGLHIDGESVIFKAIKEKKPDSFVWLGDFAYVDQRNFGGFGTHFISPLQHIRQKFYESYNDVCK